MWDVLKVMGCGHDVQGQIKYSEHYCCGCVFGWCWEGAGGLSLTLLELGSSQWSLSEVCWCWGLLKAMGV